MTERDLIRIKLHRCLLVLTELEIQALLKGRPDIWERGLKRGKGITRAEKDGPRRMKAPPKEGAVPWRL